MRTERLDAIVAHVERLREVSVHELAGMLEVPESTVRRDLRTLHEQDRIRRSYGVARAMARAPIPLAGGELSDPVDPRCVEAAGIAMETIATGNVIILPAGPVNIEIARRLRDASSVTVITNSCAVFDTVKPSGSARVVGLGGIYSRIGDCTYGPVAENALLEMRADLLMLEASGIDALEGITYDNIVEVPLLKGMMRAARRVMLIARDGLFDKTSGAVVAQIESCSGVICPGDLPERYAQLFREHRIEILTGPRR